MKKAINIMTVIFMIAMVAECWMADSFSHDRRVDLFIFNVIGLILITAYYTFVDTESPFYYKGLLEDE